MSARNCGRRRGVAGGDRVSAAGDRRARGARAAKSNGRGRAAGICWRCGAMRKAIRAPADPLEGERAHGSSCSCGSSRRKAAKATRSWVRTGCDAVAAAEQFEVLVSFAATLAEDLFRGGQLQTLALDGEAPVIVRHVRDLESWLDRLAVVEFKTAKEERGGGTPPTSGGPLASGRMC